MRIQRLSALLLACLPFLSQASAECSFESNAARHAPDMGPQHHPMGKPLPRNVGYHQPDACGDSVWFYDLNRNGRPDADEPRLYGPQRTIECESCHEASSEINKEPRQHASTLCVICHSK